METSTLEEDPDAALSQRIRNGDEKALGEFFKARGRMGYHIIFEVLRSHVDAEEVNAELMLQVWEKISEYDPDKGKFISWFCTIARRRAIDYLRRQNARDRMEERFSVLCNTAPLTERHHHQAPEDERYQRVLELLHGMEIPDEQRECMLLSWIKGRSQRDISAELGVPLGTVKTRLELGMKKLVALVKSDAFFKKL